MIDRLLKTTGQGSILDTSGWGCDVPSRTSDIPLTSSQLITPIREIQHRQLLKFCNLMTGTKGYVRRGTPDDFEKLEELFRKTRVNKQESWARAGMEFDKMGGFLDDMQHYVRASLLDPQTRSYVTIATSDGDLDLSANEKVAGYTWVDNAALPHDAHIFSGIAPDYNYLQAEFPNPGSPQVRTIGAVVVDESLRRRGIADITYLTMLHDMHALHVKELTFEIYHLLTRIREEVGEALDEKKENIQFSEIINQVNEPSRSMHEGMGARQIGWVRGAPKIRQGESGDELTQFLSRLYIMNVEEALSKLRQKLAGKFELKGNPAE